MPDTGRRSNRDKSEGSGSATRKHCTPPAGPCSSHPTSEDGSLRLSPRIRQRGDELSSLHASNLGGQHNQASPTSFTTEFRVGPLLAEAKPLRTQRHRCWLPCFSQTHRASTGETRVVSMANCAPRQSVSPSATTSSLRASSALKWPRSMSRTNMLVVTRAPASGHI